MEKNLKNTYYCLLFSVIEVLLCSKVYEYLKQAIYNSYGNGIYCFLTSLYFVVEVLFMSVLLIYMIRQPKGKTFLMVAVIVFVLMLIPNIVGSITGSFLYDGYFKFSLIKYQPKNVVVGNLSYILTLLLSAAALIISIIYYVKFCPHKSKGARIAELEREVEELKKKD